MENQVSRPIKIKSPENQVSPGDLIRRKFQNNRTGEVVTVGDYLVLNRQMDDYGKLYYELIATQTYLYPVSTLTILLDPYKQCLNDIKREKHWEIVVQSGLSWDNGEYDKTYY